MAAHIFDIDGTIVNFHTNEWIEGVKELLIQLFKEGDDIILITMRSVQDEGAIWSIENTKNTILKDLDDLGVKYIILFNVQLPRIIHNNNEIILDQRETNKPYIKSWFPIKFKK